MGDQHTKTTPGRAPLTVGELRSSLARALASGRDAELRVLRCVARDARMLDLLFAQRTDTRTAAAALAHDERHAAALQAVIDAMGIDDLSHATLVQRAALELVDCAIRAARGHEQGAPLRALSDALRLLRG